MDEYGLLLLAAHCSLCALVLAARCYDAELLGVTLRQHLPHLSINITSREQHNNVYNYFYQNQELFKGDLPVSQNV